MRFLSIFLISGLLTFFAFGLLSNAADFGRSLLTATASRGALGVGSIRILASVFLRAALLSILILFLSFLVARKWLVPGTLLDDFAEWVSSREAFLLVLGVLSGALLAAAVENWQTWLAAVAGRDALLRQTRHLIAAAVAICTVSLVAIAFPNLSTGLFSQVETISTPFVDLKFRAADPQRAGPPTVSVNTTQGLRIFRGDVEGSLRIAYNIDTHIAADRAIQQLLWAERREGDAGGGAGRVQAVVAKETGPPPRPLAAAGAAGSAQADPAADADDELSKAFNKVVKPFIGCTVDIYDVDRDNFAVRNQLHHLASPLRALAHKNASDNGVKLSQILLLEILGTYVSIDDALALRDDIPKTPNCEALQTIASENDLRIVAESCHANISGVSCNGDTARKAFDQLVRQFLPTVTEIDVIERPYLSMFLASLLAASGERLAGLMELDSWIKRAGANGGAPAGAQGQVEADVQRRLLKFRILTARAQLIALVNQEVTETGTLSRELSVQLIAEQIKDIELLAGDLDWNSLYTARKCSENAMGVAMPPLARPLRALHVSYTNNLVYHTGLLVKNQQRYLEHLLELTDMLYSYAAECAATGSYDAGEIEFLETAGLGFKRYAEAAVADPPPLAAEPDELLRKAEHAFRLCRDNAGASIDGERRRISISDWLQEDSVSLRDRCVNGLLEVRQLRTAFSRQ